MLCWSFSLLTTEKQMFHTLWVTVHHTKSLKNFSFLKKKPQQTSNITGSMVFPILNTGTNKFTENTRTWQPYMNLEHIIIVSLNSEGLFLNVFSYLPLWAVNICFSTIQTYYSVTNENATLTLSGRKILFWEYPKDELEIKTAAKQ